jgi:Domain of unknown function(DUF2779)
MNPAPLTKSRFTLATECPRKLVYDGDPRYANTRANDEFLESLARSGHQIGALAKALYPEGIEIRAPSLEEQIDETMRHLQNSSVTLFEATFRVENLVVRTDILVKSGTAIRLIEVKSKSLDPDRAEKLFRSKTGIRSKWLPYLRDAAFQTHVVRRAYPLWVVHPYLMLVDPTVVCADALGTRVRASKRGRQVTVALDPDLRFQDIRPSILVTHDIASEVDQVLAGAMETGDTTLDFDSFVDQVASSLAQGKDPEPRPGPQCRSCEFYCPPHLRTDTNRSGWAECMEICYREPVSVPRTATVFGLYSDRETAQRVASGLFLLSPLDESHIGLKEDLRSISLSHRHHLQVLEAQSRAAARFLRSDVLREAFATWRFPLHFIDFETARPCLPFHVGRKPNELLLFQFSHHTLEADGRLTHRTQILATEPGQLPNALVVSALREALQHDDGTVIHWWDHERTVLEDLREQFEGSANSGHQTLIPFVDSLLEKAPEGRLVDLGRLVAETAFFTGTGGSSSIKKVLPAVLDLSDFLRHRYSAPIYGTEAMRSLNFAAGWIWWRKEGERVVDPCALLEPLFPDAELDEILTSAESAGSSPVDFVNNGGAAMVAYGELQRTDLPSLERRQYERALLRYCELDTLAMVMVYEALREWVTTA